MNTTVEIRADLRAVADGSRAILLQRFFRTGPGQYGEGDLFLGVTVPQSRIIAKKHASVGLDTVTELLHSKYHEERLVALLILVQKYGSGEKGVVDFYLRNLRWVNNWDLVDLSAPRILGAHLAAGDRAVLYRLAKSDSIWERRIAIVSTVYFISKDDFGDTLRIAEMMLGDRHDLIHKATGWMLREVGKRDVAALEGFLDRHCKEMPRTMLRYAIERLPEKRRKFYLSQRRA